MENLTTKSYTKKVENNDLKLLIFYDEYAVLDGNGWTLSGFIKNPDFEIQEVTFMQGIDKKHDSFHVWYK